MSDKGAGGIKSAILQVAAMMELAAKTAPKTKGEDFVRTTVLTGTELADLAEAMVKFGVEKKKAMFDRDAANVAASEAVVLIGVKDAAAAGLNCGACGYGNCAELKAAKAVDGEFKGPICAYRHLDMGIAIGSAVKTAQAFNVDNRVMYRVGAGARWLGLVDWDYVMGIPLSASGKSPFFDRK